MKLLARAHEADSNLECLLWAGCWSGAIDSLTLHNSPMMCRYQYLTQLYEERKKERKAKGFSNSWPRFTEYNPSSLTGASSFNHDFVYSEWPCVFSTALTMRMNTA